MRCLLHATHVMLSAPLVSMQRGPDQLAREAGMPLRIVQQTEVGAARVFGKVVNAAVGIYFQHEDRAASVDP